MSPAPKRSAAANAKAAAAHREIVGDGPVVEFKGASFTIPAAMPFKVLAAIRDEDFVGVVEILLGDQMDAFWALDPTLLEVTEDFLPGALAQYGLDQGESAASPTS